MPHVHNAKEKRAKRCKRRRNKCYWCGEPMNSKPGDAREATLEHLTPRSNGGGGRIGNLRAVCRECNERRGSLPVAEWEERLRVERVERAKGLDF